MKYILLGWCCAVGLLVSSAPAQAITVAELQAQVDVLLAQLAAMQATSTATTTSFVPGVHIETTDTVRVRSYYGLLGSLAGLQPAGVTGTIVTGPFTSDGYRWVKVDFVTGSDGWVTTGWLQSQSEATTTQATTTVTYTSWGIGEIIEITQKGVDPIPGAVDDEYTSYHVSLTDGTTRDIMVYPFSDRAMQVEAFTKSGYTGAIEALLALSGDETVTVELISNLVIKDLTITFDATVSQDTGRLASVCGPTQFGTVSWGDGKTETIYGLGCSSLVQQVPLTHTYAKKGSYSVVVTDQAKNRTEKKIVVTN